ncbi:MAG: helix-turn-helix domain-containing protein [Weeksellaceae bacterium]|jgi:addiction module HigA family antidote
MNNKINILKGIPSGKIIERDLLKRNISQRTLASAVHEHYQTINAIISGRRRLTTELALKIEKELDYPEGFLLIIQAYNDIAIYKQSESRETTEIPNIRRNLFWDTNFDTIDWNKHKRAIIDRILERGNQKEIEEIARFYNLKTEELRKYKYNNTYRIHSLSKNKI